MSVYLRINRERLSDKGITAGFDSQGNIEFTFAGIEFKMFDNDGFRELVRIMGEHDAEAAADRAVDVINREILLSMLRQFSD